MNRFVAILLLVALYVFVFLHLGGCTTHTTNVVSTNKLVQTDYDYNCFDGTKTFSQIIVCQQEQDEAEKTQNKVTNDLLRN